MGMKKSIHIFVVMKIMGRRAYLEYIVKLLHLEPKIAKFKAHRMDICSRWQAWIVVYLCAGVWRYRGSNSTVPAFLLYNFCFWGLG